MQDLKKEGRAYLFVFAALIIFTILTVTISKLHVALAVAIIVALAIAIFKGSLVVSFFMHFIHEKKIILWLMFCVFLFFMGMILSLYFGEYSIPHGAKYVP